VGADEAAGAVEASAATMAAVVAAAVSEGSAEEILEAAAPLAVGNLWKLSRNW
jgi:hypothetical protein